MSRRDAAAVSFRTAGSGDAALLEALARKIWVPHYTPIIGCEQVHYMLQRLQSEDAIRRDIENGYVYDIAFCGGAPCGYCAVRGDGDSHFLSKLYVLEERRGLGLARALLAALLRHNRRVRHANRRRIRHGRLHAGKTTDLAQPERRPPFLPKERCYKRIFIMP
jgi:GNAT superfamily N-acetyltransferase